MADIPDHLDLTDPRVMRGLAHPLRLALLRLLAQQGAATATELAGQLGVSAPSASYHLSQLAKFGFVVDAPRPGGGRDRPWQAVARGFRWASGANSTPETAAAAAALRRQLTAHGLAALSEYETAQERYPGSWREAAFVITDTVLLTSEELTEVAEEVRQVVARAQRRHGGERAGAAVRPVRLFAFGVPDEPPPVADEGQPTVTPREEPSDD
ncbi:winged helix-turn-helix domain-containing protein [Micromonospora sp. H61]|uniref:winged helix-turn-helix domain-containing protein n=1 Tax=unclassified Micromonospora TaxID=2617518 RepID=UPI001B36BA20|nr:winged helix-turn-helix domain-containing protein [Micromonospora sp. H61]MBQ0988757.1 winged helix-turn-helix transcriptional regulator [Micromonospora sp. H61]